jgi:hypothetical protein
MQRTKISNNSAFAIMAMMLCFGTADARRQKLIQIDGIAASVHRGNTQPRRLRKNKSSKTQHDLMSIDELNQKVKDLNLDLGAMFDETEWDFRAGIASMSMVRYTLSIEYSKCISR